MNVNKITHCISTYNNLFYLKLAIESVRENGFYKDAKLFIYSENSTDGTNEWLSENKDKYQLDYLVENNAPAKGIGGGMNVCAENVTTEYINFIHADMYCTKDFDKPLLDFVNQPIRVVACSWRVEPNIYDQPSRLGTIMVPPNAFGEFHSNFDKVYFNEWVEEFKKTNDVQKFRKLEGVSFMIRKSDWDYIGGCDSRFAPSSFEDNDLFARMICEGYNFVETSESLVYHFVSRSVYFNDDNSKKSQRQIECETRNRKKWVEKWGEPLFHDMVGFTGVSEQMKQRYYKNKK